MARLLPIALVALAACARPAPERPRPPLHPELPPEPLVRFTDQMGSSFRFVQARFVVDDQLVYEHDCAYEDDACRASLRRPVTVLYGRTSPGQHELTAQLVYRSHGHGIFSYINAYRFQVRSRHEAPAEWGRRTVVDARAHERGGPTTPLEERPALDWNGQWTDL